MICGKQNVDKSTNFFTICGLFSPNTTLHCFVTGVLASTSVTVDDAQSTGLRILKDIMDKKFSEYISPVQNHLQFVWRLKGAEKMYQSTHNCYFNVWVWLHLLRQMTPGKNHLVMSFAHALQYSLTTYSSDAMEPRVSLMTPYGGLEIQNQKPTVVCLQCETDDINTEEAWVKTRQNIDRDSLLHRTS